jgi:hypothetical protein
MHCIERWNGTTWPVVGAPTNDQLQINAVFCVEIDGVAP